MSFKIKITLLNTQAILKFLYQKYISKEDVKLNKIVFLSESDIGIHGTFEKDDIYIDLIVSSFIPVVTMEKENYVFHVPESLIAEISKKATSSDDYIFIGFDLDVQGELMATSLYESLLKIGYKKNNIKRIPLAQYGYIAEREFLPLTEYRKYIFLQNEFIKKQKAAGIKKPLGFKKSIAFELLNKYAGMKSKTSSNISQPNGISTVTVVTNFINGAFRNE